MKLETRFSALRSAVKRAKSLGCVKFEMTSGGGLLGYRMSEGRGLADGTLFLVNYPVIEIVIHAE